jgi:hypothetical protein
MKRYLLVGGPYGGEYYKAHVDDTHLFLGGGIVRHLYRRTHFEIGDVFVYAP